MYKKLLFGLSIAAVLLSLAAGLTLAQTQLPGPDTLPASPDRLSDSPWHRKFVESVRSPTPLYLGAYSSVAFDPRNDIPFISYYDATHGYLRLASPVTGAGANCGVNGDWWCRNVDTSGNVGKYSSIDIWSSYPIWSLGISYHDVTNNQLKFAQYHCHLNSCAWTFSAIAGNVLLSAGTGTSLKYDSNGVPHIAYHSYGSLTNTDRLEYAHYVGSGGNCGPDSDWQCDTIDSGSGVGKFPSLDLSSTDEPRISYYDEGNGNLKFTYYVAAPGSGQGCGPAPQKWVCIPIDTTNDVGKFTSLSVQKTSPYHWDIAYYDVTNGALKHARYVGSGGNCAFSGISLYFEWQCDWIADMGTGLTQAGIAIGLDADGGLVIAYEDATDDMGPSMLNIATPALMIGNCGPAVPIFYTWQCDTLDSGGSSYVYEASFVAMAFDSTGLPIIAYTESDDYYTNQNLKVMYQQMQVFLPLINRNSP